MKLTQNFWKLFFGILPFFFVLFLFSCNDDSNLIGIDILPPGDNVPVRFYEESNFTASTFLVDSVRSDEDNYSATRNFNLLGSYVDPVFGGLQAGFLTQIRLSKNSVNFGDGFKIDSLVLYLDMAGYYGDMRQFMHQNFYLYELTDTLALSEDYYSNINVNNYISEESLRATQVYFPLSSDTLMAIKLNPEDYYSILSDTNNLIDNEIFTDVIKGFYLGSDQVQSGGSILYFDLLSDLSRLTLYYHEAGDTSFIEPASAQKSFNFLINENCARINVFKHDYEMATTPFSLGSDSSLNDSSVYIQACAGPQVELDMSNLMHWRDSSDVIITRAELILPVQLNSNTIYNPLSILSLVRKSAEDEYLYLPDQYHNGTFYSNYFDGAFTSDSLYYHFNIAQYVQDFINGNIENDPLILRPYATENPVIANRCILNKPDLLKGMKIRITYLKI